jgi:hypothetical protein
MTNHLMHEKKKKKKKKKGEKNNYDYRLKKNKLK